VSGEGDDLRLFLALALPEPVRAELAHLRRALERRDDRWRWAPVDRIHLTVRFLGRVAAAPDRALRDAWRLAAAASPPIAFRLRGLGAFPSESRPRVVWVGVEELDRATRLAALAAAIETAARTAGFEHEARAFRPHLTLARAARSGRPRFPGGDFEGRHIVAARELGLYRSELLPAGPRYTRLESFPFEGCGPGEDS